MDLSGYFFLSEDCLLILAGGIFSSMDSFILNAIVQEFQAHLCPSKLNTFWQPDDHSIILSLWHHGHEDRVAISIAPQQQYLFVSSAPMQGEVLAFSKFLLHHLKGGELRGISKPPFERVITFDIVKKDIDGQLLRFQLILELMGRHSNLILINQETQKILESLRHVTAAQSSYRRIAPGAVYEPPPKQEKRDPLALNREQFAALVRTYQHDRSQGKNALPFWKFFLEQVEGFSPLLAKDLAGEYDEHTDERLWQRFAQMLEVVKTGHYQPHLLFASPSQGESVPTGISAIRLLHTICTPVESMNAAAERYYTDAITQQQRHTLRNGLLATLQARLTKLYKKRQHLREQFDQIENAEQYQRSGELLTANLHQLRKGMQIATVVDYYAETQAMVTIPLDPRLTPSQNAQRYFKRYSKLKQGKAIAEQRLQETEQTIAYLEEWQFFVEDAATVERLQALHAELHETDKPAPKASRKSAPTEKSAAGQFLRMVSSDGFEIYVGRSSKENDALTQRTAQPDDLWLHVHQAPGAHVLILNRQRNAIVPEQTIREAASLAAYYSKARQNGKVEVIYTPRKYVKKPKGSPPGLVRVLNFQTIRVTPCASLPNG